jgi:hypothetical protein
MFYCCSRKVVQIKVHDEPVRLRYSDPLRVPPNLNYSLSKLEMRFYPFFGAPDPNKTPGQYGVTVLGIEVALRVKNDGNDDSVLLPAEFVQMGSPSARQGTTTDVVTDTWGEQHAG